MSKWQVRKIIKDGESYYQPYRIRNGKEETQMAVRDESQANAMASLLNVEEGERNE